VLFSNPFGWQQVVAAQCKDGHRFLICFFKCFSFLFWLIAIPIRALLLFQGAAY